MCNSRKKKLLFKHALELNHKKIPIDLTDMFPSAVTAAKYLHTLYSFDIDIGYFIYEGLLYKINNGYYSCNIDI